MIVQNTVRGEWMRFELDVIDKSWGAMGHNHVIKAAARRAFIAGASSMFRLVMVNIAIEPTVEKQQAAKQAIAEELTALIVEAEQKAAGQ